MTLARLHVCMVCILSYVRHEPQVSPALAYPGPSAGDSATKPFK